MALSHNIKHQLLREAVQENTGQRPRIPSRPPETRRSFWPRPLFAILFLSPFLLLGGVFLLALDPLNGYNVTRLLAFASNVLGREQGREIMFMADVIEETYPVPKPIDFRVFPLGVRKIIIDPGHGGVDGGAEAAQGILEKEITLDIAIRLRNLLEKDAYHVVMTREADITVSLNQRVELANTESADLFVSIHANWFKTSTTHGVETYYLGPTDDPHTLQLAALENNGSGYNIGDFRLLLENIYLNVRRNESRQLATAIQHHLGRSVRRINPDLNNRGVKMAPFLVLVSTKMPAVLAEVSFLSNRHEARLLATTRYRQGIAQALYKGIHGYAKTLNRTAKKGSAL